MSEIVVDDASEIALEKGWYCPEFGKKQQNTVIRLSSSGTLPQSLGYRIIKRTKDSETPPTVVQ